ncbi:MAG TPA: hypothetical protein VIL10_07565, partial [Marmoricola sp.]
MTPLQKIAMGLVIVLVPANFPRDPHPEWRFYDALPDPLGWLLVLAGVWALSRASSLDLDLVRWLGVVAFVVSVPLWFPQVSHLLVPEHNPDITVSFQWFVALPQTLFSLFLVRAIGRAAIDQQPRDVFVAGRFGVLTWGLATLVVLPVVAYGGSVDALVTPTLLLIGIVNIAVIYYLFRVHRRTWLGG